MLVSYRWLCELAGVKPTPEDLGHKLTFSGIEVEDVTHVGASFDNIVVGEIKTKQAHPDKSKLSLVTVDSGDGVLDVVCGASNCPAPGGRVVLAKVGAQVGDFVIEPRKVGGYPSSGMLCSEVELDIGSDDDGIIILGETVTAEVGTPIAQALDLEDWILEIGVTPNRPDALSHRGLARDVALLYGKPYSPKVAAKAPEGGAPVGDAIEVVIEDQDGCPRYGGAVVRGVKVGPSPFALRYRLHNLGIRPISNLVDMTNLIVLEYGQPLHAFDLSELAGPKILVRRAVEGEKMKTLDGIERVFDTEDLLICDAKTPVALAGVMGGEESGVVDGTTDILIECAYFNPSRVRRSSKKFKLSSESSYRFERGVDPNGVADVLEAAAILSVELAGGTKAPGIVDCYPVPIEPQSIAFRPARFAQVMGYEVPTGEMKRILVGLGAQVSGDETALQVIAPTARPDLEREIDIVEEIARIYGYEHVPTSLPRIQCNVPERPAFEAERKAKRILSKLGLDEAVCYSFVPEQLLALVGKDKNHVPIANPLNAERAAMRTTLIAGLLENLKRATSRFLPGIRQFEVGYVFEDVGEVLPKETLKASILISGPANTWVGESTRPWDFYDMKAIAQEFIEEFCGLEPEMGPLGSETHMHPRRALALKIGDTEVGMFGELHPDVLAGLKLSDSACSLEVNLEKLLEAARLPAAKPLSEYPPMARDVAMLLAEEQDAGPVCNALKEACGSLAQLVNVFDVYRGKGIDEGKKSLAFSIIYRSDERTLTDAEVDKIHQKAVNQVSKRFGATVR